MALQNIEPNSLPNEFIESILKGINKDAQFLEYRLTDMDASDSILTFLAQMHQTKKSDKKPSFVGFFKMVIDYMFNGVKKQTNVVVKCKPPAEAIRNMLPAIGRFKDEEMSNIFKRNKEHIIVSDTELREIESYRLQSPVVKAICPKIYLTIDDKENDLYIIAMEDLTSEDFILHKTVNTPQLWEEKHVKQVLKDLAFFHAKYLDDTEDIPVNLRHYVYRTYQIEKIKSGITFMQTCLEHNKALASDIYDEQVCAIIYKALDHIDDIYTKLWNEPYTLIHADVNPRNLCIRVKPEENQRHLCLYDWEVCTLQVPQLDVLDFLIHVLQEDESIDTLKSYLTAYQENIILELKTLNKYNLKLQKSLEKDNFLHVFYICVLHTVLFRYGIPTFYNVYHPISFFPRVAKILMKYLKLQMKDIPFFQNI